MRRRTHRFLTLPVVPAGIEAAHALANSLTGAPATEVFASAASGRGALEPVGDAHPLRRTKWPEGWCIPIPMGRVAATAARAELRRFDSVPQQKE